MKNVKKLLSIILVFVMVMQILPVFAAEGEAQAPAAEIIYIINDDFGNDNLNHWSLIKDSGYSSLADDLVTTEEIKDEAGNGTGNYALKYFSTDNDDTWRYTHIKREIPESVLFSTNKDVVIETRIKTTGLGRAFLKYNLVTYPSITNEWNYNWGTLIGIDGEKASAIDGWKTSIDDTTLYNGNNPMKALVDDASNTWYTYKLTIHGGDVDTQAHTATGSTMDVEVTNDNNEIIKEITGLDIDFPENSTWTSDAIENVSWVEDALNSLDFRLRKQETLLVDYVKVYEKFDADMSVEEFIYPDEDVKVTVSADEVITELKDAFELYDANGELISTTNTISGNVVSLAHGGLEEGKYTVKLKESAVPENYIFVTKEKTFTVSNVKYYLYDEFGNNDLNDWKLVKDAGKTTNDTTTLSAKEITGESGNYALEYVSAGTSANDWIYNHITKDLVNSVSFASDKEVVIETRMKTQCTGRAYLKYNLVTYPDIVNEYEYWWGTLVGSDGNRFFIPNGWKASETYSSTPLNTAWSTDTIMGDIDPTDKWFTYKFVIKGGEIDTATHTATGNTMDVTVTDNDGNLVKSFEGLSIDFPNNSTWVNVDGKMNWVEDALNSLDFRLRQQETLLVDYVKVYEKFDADMSVEEFIYPDEVIEVTVDAKEVAPVLKDAFELYDANNTLISTTNTISGNVVSLAHSGLEEGRYTVKLKESAVPENYIFATKEKTFTVSDVKYYLYDEFGNNDLNDWKLKTYTGKTEAADIVTEAIGDTENYALKFTTTDADYKYNFIAKSLPYSLAFEEDKDIVIETRMKQIGASARSYLKYNMDESKTYTDSTFEELEYQYGGLVANEPGWYLTVVNGRPSDTSVTNERVVPGGINNEWYKIKVTIHGNTKKASFEIVDESTTPATQYLRNNMNIANIEAANWVENVLNSVNFRARNANTILVDYVKVYKKINADISVDIYNRPNKPIEVTIDAEEIAPALKNAFELYDANGVLVPTTNTINGNVVSLAHNGLTDDAEYTVKVKASAVPENYVFTTTEGTFKTSNIKYYVNDEFGNNDKNGWEAKAFSGCTSSNSAVTEPIAENSTNYVLKYSSTNPNGVYYGYLSKSFAPINLTAGKDIVIETKLMHTGNADKGRFNLKYNLAGMEFYANEYAHNWGQLLDVEASTADGVTTDAVALGKGWKINATTQKYSGQTFEQDVLGDISTIGNYYIYKVILHGGETKDDVTADVIICDENGTEKARREGLSLDFPDNSNWSDALTTGDGATGVNWVEGVLNSLDFRFRIVDTLYIDYVKVYDRCDAYASIDVKEMLGNANIGAYIIGGSEVIDNFEECVSLYNGETEVEAAITQVEGENKVVINPAETLENGTYTVKFDKAKIFNEGYTLNGNTEISFNVISSADVNESFENLTTDTLASNGWYFREDGLEGVTKTAEIRTDDGSDNKYLRIAVTGNLKTGDGKLVTYSKALDGSKFVRDMEKSTAIELKIRTNTKSIRKYFKYNYPTSGDINTNAYNEFGWNTRVGAVMDSGDIRISYGSANMEGLADVVSTYDVDNWYTVRTVFDNASQTANSYIYDADGVLVGSAEDKELSAWWFNYYDYNKTTPQVMHTIEDLTFQFRPEKNGVEVTNEYFDIDDIKIYKFTEVAESATVSFKDSVTSGPVTEITETGSLVPVFDIQVKDNGTAEYYIIAAKYENGRLVDGSLQMKEVEVSGNSIEELDAIAVDKDNTGLVVKAFVWNKNMVPVCRQAEVKPRVYTIYMATKADGGNDANEGYENAPVATLNRAIELANDAKTKGYSASEVIVADGNYLATGETISIGDNLNADSLTIRSETPKGAKFINGITFKISDAVEAPADIKARVIDEGAREKLYMLDLTKQVALEDIPGANLWGTYSYSADGVEYMDGETKKTLTIEETDKATCEFFFKNAPMTVARYPDNDYEKTQAGNFTYDVNSRTRYWKEGADKDPNHYIPIAERVNEGFTITTERAKDWGSADQALMFGYFYYDWATESVPVKSVDTTTGTITSKYPAYYGVNEGQRYYVYNLLEEISQEKEYFVDRKTGMMYFYMPDGAKPDDEIIMSLYDNKIIDITASNVTIDGLTLTASRGDVIRCYGDNVTIKNCDISNSASTAVSINGTNNVIEYCNIHDVNWAISLSGGDLATLTPGNNKALNNTITNYSRITKTSTDAIRISGVGNKASHNKISDGEHQAISFSGVDNEISYNEITNVMKESNEGSAIYTWASWTTRGTVIKHNYLHDIITNNPVEGYEVAGIMIDNFVGDIQIYGNIFENILGFGIKGTGRDITISNNIFEKCTGKTARFLDSKADIAYFTRHESKLSELYGNSVWLNRFGTTLFTENGMSYNPDLINTANLVYKNNFATGMSNGATFDTVGTNENLQTPNMVFTENHLNGNYTNNGEVIKAYLSDFEHIPFDQIGVNGTAGRE